MISGLLQRQKYKLKRFSVLSSHYITLASEQQADYILQVLNMDGRVVYNREYNSVAFVNESTDTGISELGLYLIRIIQ
jgi:hypothetical protein